MILLQSMMDQMINQLKLQYWVETWEVLVFQALAIPYLSYLNQMVVLTKMDFLQQSIMVIYIWMLNNGPGPLNIWCLWVKSL